MPQAIAYGLAAVFTAGTVTAAITFASYAITLLGSLALSSYQKRKAERAARAQFDAAQVDRLANVPSTVAQRELVMGVVRKGGHVFFKASVGQYKELFIMCIAVASHEIDAIERVYLNDQPVDVNEVGQVTSAPYGQAATLSADKDVPFGSLTVVLDYDPLPGSVSATESPFGQVGGHEVKCSVDGRVVTIIDPLPGWTARVHYQYAGFNSFVNIRWHLGSPDQTADGGMTAMLPGVWTWEHRARGIAYLVCQFAYNDGALPSGIPNVTVRMRGAKIYDPRDGVTRYTENPALMMRHVMMHPQFGKRTSMSAAEDARIIAAANGCDTPNDYGSGVFPLFRASSVFPFGTAARDVLDDLAQAMAGEWAFAAGEYFVRAGVYQLPVMSLTDADLAVVRRNNDGSVSQGSISISPHRPRNDTFNMVVIRIWDEAANFVETPITPFRADALVATDGAELSQEVTMPAVFFAPQAYHIAGVMLRDGRDPLTVTLPFKMRAYPLELFDGVTLTLARFGFVAKEFRIVSRVFSPEGLVQLTLKETTAAIYAYGAGFLPGGSAPNTSLPQPWQINPPVVVSVNSGEGELVVQSDGTIVNGVRVAWSPIADQSIVSGGSVELQYRVLPDGAWISVTAPGDASEVRFTGVEDLAMILIRLRSRNGLATSIWGTQVLHQVIGKTEPPPDIVNLSIAGSVLSWSLPRRVPDLAGFVFRFHYGSNVDWGSAAPLHTGLVTASPWEPETRPGGVVTIMGKAQDTSGNQSKAAGVIVMNLGDAPIANVLEQWDFRAQGWPIPADRGPLAPGRYAQYGVANIYSAARASTATYFASGVLQTAGVNVPRFTYDPANLSAPPALLIDGAATNSLLYSEQFDAGTWAKSNLTVTANAAVAPDASPSADKLVESAANVNRGAFQTQSFAAGLTYTTSVFAKAAERQSIQLNVAGYPEANFNLLTGQISSVAAANGNFVNYSAAIETWGNGWFRCSVTRTCFLGLASTAVRIYMNPTASYSALAVASYAGDGVSGLYLWGAQSEQDQISSYIPTTTAAATRAADIVYVSEGQSGYAKSGGDLVANGLDSFYGTNDQSFYKGDAEPFYGLGNYAQLVYVTPEISVNSALAGSVMTVEAQVQGTDLRIEYRLAAPGSFYGPDSASFYGADSTPFYSPPGEWMPWPGQLVAARDAYQFRVTIGAGSSQGVLQGLLLTIDAPDMQEVLADVAIAAGGTFIPYIKPFTSIKAITTTLQANGSGAVTTETDKTNPLAPKIRAFNAAHTSVGGATADIVIQGY